MKGCPSLIESNTDPSRKIYVLVLQKLGPSLEELCRLMSESSPNVRFDEKMTMALAIQMVRGFFLVHKLYLLLISFDKLDRYADLHARKIIHNGAKPGNICATSLPSDTSESENSTLYLIDFGCSFFCDNTRLDYGEEFSGNKRFWSVLSYHAFSEFFFFHIIRHTCPFINAEILL
jgi:serine/threonine protein kinase